MPHVPDNDDADRAVRGLADHQVLHFRHYGHDAWPQTPSDPHSTPAPPPPVPRTPPIGPLSRPTALSRATHPGRPLVG